MSENIDPKQSYPVTGRNRVKRLHERASYDREAVHAILDAGMLCHVAYVIDGQPFCTPTIHWRKDDRLYWHGSSASRMLRHLKAGTPVCVTVSHLDGLVLARSGFHHSANYRSAMCFGTARIVDDPDEKAEALSDVVDRFYPGRTATLRQSNAQEIKATTVIGMDIETASAKVRDAGVADDEDDLDLPIWAGVIPVKTVIGASQTSPHVPEGIAIPEDLAHLSEGSRFDEALLRAHALYSAM
jgi:nitroimidazol reductase NimA-like FMN-containing flavoprotein (pyridoxamine 5'-phosphate oxidase superfamily)